MMDIILFSIASLLVVMTIIIFREVVNDLMVEYKDRSLKFKLCLMLGFIVLEVIAVTIELFICTIFL